MGRAKPFPFQDIATSFILSEPEGCKAPRETEDESVPMTKRIRWGILSTGDIAGAFAKDLKLLPDADLVAVGSRTRERAEDFGQEHGIPHRHGSYEALAQDPDVDVSYVATPHTFHAENTILCLNSGKAVLCEKAFALNARQAKEMVELAREKELFLMEAMVTRHFPVIKQVRQWVEEGRIGEVRMVQATRCANGVYPPEGRHMNLNLGGGSLLDVGIYVLSFCSMFFGEPPIRTQGSAHFEDCGADGQGSVVLQYPNGGLGALSFALTTKGEDTGHVYGSQGRIHVHPPVWAPTKATLIIPGEEDETFEIPKEGNGLNYEAVEVMRCLREGEAESPIMPLDETLNLMRIMDELRRDWGLVYPGE